MVVVGAVDILDVQGDAGIHGERLEELAHQLGVEGTDLRRGEGDVPDQEGPARHVHRRAGHGLVHGEVERGIAGDAAPVAERRDDLVHDRCGGGGGDIAGAIQITELERVEAQQLFDLGAAHAAPADLGHRLALQIFEHQRLARGRCDIERTLELGAIVRLRNQPAGFGDERTGRHGAIQHFREQRQFVAVAFGLGGEAAFGRLRQGRVISAIPVERRRAAVETVKDRVVAGPGGVGYRRGAAGHETRRPASRRLDRALLVTRLQDDRAGRGASAGK